MTFTILSITAAFALVATFLAYLLLLSRLHWVFKALATVSTIALIPLTFHGVGELRGLPSDGPIPSNFTLLWAQVVANLTCFRVKRVGFSSGCKRWTAKTIRRSASGLSTPLFG